MDLLFIDNLFDTPESLEEYKLTSFPFNLKLVKERLDARLQEDPNYEVFLPVYFYGYEGKVRAKNFYGAFKPAFWFVSNKGRVYSSRLERMLTPGINTWGYVTHSGRFSGNSVKMTLHRMVACSFVPLKEEHHAQALRPKDLQVNHKSGVKSDCDYSNLEWATQSENVIHAYENKLFSSGLDRSDIKPLKGRVIRGSYIGFEFIVIGRGKLAKLGFDKAACSKVANGRDKSHRNCVWSFATDEEINSLSDKIPAEILKDIRDTCPLAKFKTVGTHIQTGETITFVGKRQGKLLGFSSSTIAEVVAGKRPQHKGYTWKYELIEVGS